MIKLRSFLLFFVAIISLESVIPWTVAFAAPKKASGKKDDDFDKICQQFQEKDKSKSALERALGEEFSRKFALTKRVLTPEALKLSCSSIDNFRKEYGVALKPTRKLVSTFGGIVRFLDQVYRYTERYNDLIKQATFEPGPNDFFVSHDQDVMPADAADVGGFFMFDSSDADLVAINNRMANFIVHFMCGVINPNPASNPNYSYDPEKDKEFLMRVISSDSFSEEARQAAQRFIAQGELYLLQKKAMAKNDDYAYLEREIKVMLENPSNLLAKDIIKDRQVTHAMIERVTKSKNSDFGQDDAEKIAELKQKYESLLKKIDDELKRLSVAQQFSLHKQQPSTSKTTQKIPHPKMRKKKPQLGTTSSTLSSDEACEESEIQELDNVSNSCEQDFSMQAANVEISTAGAVSRQCSVPTIAELEGAVPIKSYFTATVLNWFSKYGRENAINREVAQYPFSNQNPSQIDCNIAAHTFPFVIDSFISKLAHRFELSSGAVLYAIPGSLYVGSQGKEQIGYYKWGVTQGGQCFHRSFTLRKFQPTDRLSGKGLYDPNEIERLLKDHDCQGSESSEQIFCETRDSLAITTNGLTVRITDRVEGNVFKLIIPE